MCRKPVPERRQPELFLRYTGLLVPVATDFGQQTHLNRPALLSWGASRGGLHSGSVEGTLPKSQFSYTQHRNLKALKP